MCFLIRKWILPLKVEKKQEKTQNSRTIAGVTFMFLKRLILVLFLISATVAHSSESQSASAVSIEESAPASPHEIPMPPDHGPAPLPSSTEMTSSYESAFVRMLVTLLALVALVFATFWILRRLGKGKFMAGSGGRSINVIEKRALSPKSMLYIVEIGNKKVLISESQVEVRALTAYEETTRE
jgi:flagellar protein FliO/FliZ